MRKYKDGAGYTDYALRESPRIKAALGSSALAEWDRSGILFIAEVLQQQPSM